VLLKCRAQSVRDNLTLRPHTLHQEAQQLTPAAR